MKKIVLLTGSGGFVGSAVLRRADEFGDLLIRPLKRSWAAKQVKAARREYPAAQISLLNLAWPSMTQYSASRGEPEGDDLEWRAFRAWLSGLIEAAAQTDARFFHIGSGIEPFALGKTPVIGEPYLGYARRKDQIWRQVKTALPGASWRLRLHFLFGPGEAAHRFIPAAIRAFRNNASLEMGAPDRRRCWMHVDDAARGLVMAASETNPENWDICAASPVSFDQLLALIEEVTGGVAEIRAPERDIADADCLVAAPTKLAPFLPVGVGEVDDLRKRLKDYAQALAD